MPRSIISLLTLLLPVGILPAQSGSPTPVIRISVYAAPQADSSLHITGLQYDAHGVHFAFSNDADREVIGATIVATYAVPAACAQPSQLHATVGMNESYRLRLGPHEKSSVIASAPIPVGALVGVAWKAEVANLQVQFGVFEIDFADGTKWKRHEESPQGPFDPALVNADKGPCSDAVIVGRDLREIEVKLDRSIEKPTYENDGAVDGPPHLSFQCRVQGSKAVCPLP